jgi:hypothetical protein
MFPSPFAGEGGELRAFASNEPGEGIKKITPHPPSLRSGTVSRKGRGKFYCLRAGKPVDRRAYFAAAGNTGNFSTSRASCWMITVALVFAAIFLRRSSDAMVCARS